MKYNFVISFSLLLIFANCSCKQEQAPCKLQNIETLFYVPNWQDGEDTAYGHTLIIQDFDRRCLDSTSVVKLALAYIDTVKVGKPVNVVQFYKSKRYFISNKISQVVKEINRDCLVSILFDEKRKRPKVFVFYNDDGERIYWGAEWKPSI